ncbi:MAG: M48 family metallopeptidase [Alphaproteobacteria bacterium]|nr:M48 family metallopeptidase [Alphaproteobacteria bacterium]
MTKNAKTSRIETITIGDRAVEIAIRRSPRARCIALRIDPAIGGAEIVLPPGASESEGLAFVATRGGWLLDRLDQMPRRITFKDGVAIPLYGEATVIRHAPDKKIGVALEDNQLVVGGREEHLARRLKDWLRRDARRVISPLAWALADGLGQKPARISIRDQRSRWGSCSSTGALSFNWRLVLAPPFVLEYVTAHEVAHMQEMNHSPAFWSVVNDLTAHCVTGRKWLKTNGGGLHSYG